jgi:hypothetical protein
LLTFTLNGAPPLIAYQAQEAEYFSRLGSYVLLSTSNQSSFIANNNGDVTFTVLVNSYGGDIFVVKPAVNSNTVGWIGGFSVPR